MLADLGEFDVYFLFATDKGVKQKVPAHRNVLAQQSSVLKSVFDAALKDDIRHFNVNGVSKALFKEFLKYFYQNDAVNMSMERVSDLLHLGYKYKMKKCIDECVEFLIEKLRPGNVCSILKLAIFYEHIKLLKECKTVIFVNTEAVFKSNDFLTCDKKVLAYILKMNTLMCSETDVFKACMLWVMSKSRENEITKKDVSLHLGDLFYEIRFASMSYDEFCTLATKYRSILWSEFPTITNLIAKSGDQSSKFNATPRQFKWNKRAIINCDRILNTKFERNFDFDDIEETVFVTNNLLILGSFTCCEISSPYVKVQVTITETRLTDGTTSCLLQEMPVILHSKGTITLSQTVLIRCGFFYKISIKKCSHSQVFYSNELQTKIVLDAKTIVEFHNYSSCKKTGKVIGLISALQFNRI